MRALLGWILVNLLDIAGLGLMVQGIVVIVLAISS